MGLRGFGVSCCEAWRTHHDPGQDAGEIDHGQRPRHHPRPDLPAAAPRVLHVTDDHAKQGHRDRADEHALADAHAQGIYALANPHADEHTDEHTDTDTYRHIYSWAF